MALLGIALVVFLFLTQLTVTTGVVNGLILYANIVSANEVTFNLREVYFFRIFIAWVNLDFGIHTCFHDGMNHLIYAAWQFAFPIYLWLLVAFIIILCHYSIRASKFFGKTDPVAVLATLMLLSYNKLLRNIITILTPTTLQYPPGTTDVSSVVWLYDGNVVFCEGGHAVLTVIALLALILLFLPFTLLLIFAQFLQKSRWISRCLNKFNLSHALRSYQEPYKPPSRYWIGLCLLLRGIIQITLVSTSNENTSARILAISTICTVLISVIGLSGGIYSKRRLDILEVSYIFNLGILAVLAYHIQLAGGSQVAATYVSTAIAFLTFIGVTVAMVYRQLKKAGHFQRYSVFKKQTEPQESINDLTVEGEKNEVTSQEVFLTKIDRATELREVLLEDTV